ncbi:MAG: response regulator [Candidatus Palauibacterales bacterium]|nr:response regulator [Candidatus Palauibacterales bacterium]
MRRQVLICDDAMFMRSVVASVLSGAGYEIVGEAATGAEAVTRFQELRPHVMTMDLLMPEMGGLDALKAIRAIDPEARIVICSAMGQEHLMQQATAAGACAFVVKPFKPEALLAAVDQALAHGTNLEGAA